MKLTKLSSGLIALATLSLAACGKDSDKKKDADREPARVSSITSGVALTSTTDDRALLGDWNAACTPDSSGKDLSTRITFSFKENHAVLSASAFFDRFCSSRGYTTKTLMTYRASAKTLETLSERFTVFIQDDRVAQVAADQSVCGFNKWSTGVEYDLTDVPCSSDLDFGNNQSGERLRGPYSINGNVLDFGGGFVLVRGTSASSKLQATPASRINVGSMLKQMAANPALD